MQIDMHKIKIASNVVSEYFIHIARTDSKASMFTHNPSAKGNKIAC